MHGDHHCAEIIRLEHGGARFEFLHSTSAPKNFEAMDKVWQLFAFLGIDDANAFERDVQSLGDFFDFRSIAKKYRHAQSQGIELTGSLQDARFGSFREHDSLRMPLQFFYDTA